MTGQLQIRVYRHRELCQTTFLEDKLQVGRQRPGEKGPFHVDREASRMVVAVVDDKLVSREHLQLQRIEENGERSRLEVRNLSRKRSVMVENFGKLGPQEAATLDVPVLVAFEDFAIRIESLEPAESEFRSLAHMTIAPGLQSPGKSIGNLQKTILPAAAEEYSTEQLIHWLEQTMDVLQSASGAEDFLSQAVDAVEQIVGLDTISALRYEGGTWSIEASKTKGDGAEGTDARAPSRTILQQVLEKKSTVYQLPTQLHPSASLQGIKALVASPILDASENIIGALYGARFSRQSAQFPQITELEATMVEVIACSAAAGLAREEHQKRALAARIKFEQFFTPQLARELEANPNLLDGQDADVSILFCDIVGFSSVSQRIGPRKTMQWIGDVMDRLSGAILENDGVVVDYIGDELMAMWGAPKPQEMHAAKACLAAMQLMQCKEAVDASWLDETQRPLDFRIGISSGIASVGNTGSTRRLKYGPLGNTVNLASRLQSAAKQFGVKKLICKSTADAIDHVSQLRCRPLGSARFVNISSQVDVFQLTTLGDENVGAVSRRYSEALNAIERSDHGAAITLLERLIGDFPDDLPSQFLLKRLKDGKVASDCIWQLETK